MGVFSEAVQQYWWRPFVGHDMYRDDDLSIVINSELDNDENVTILHSSSYMHTAVALLPDVAKALRASGVFEIDGSFTEGRLREGLLKIGVVMHGADNLYYLPQINRQAWLTEAASANIRQLDASDAGLFAVFESQVSEQDIEAAQVDLDDWAVFGMFDDQGQLLSIASAYPWGNSPMADVGILTLASARGMGYAKRLLRVVGRHAMANGYELQYRSQQDNKASLALAVSAGLELFGQWEIPSPDAHT